LFCKQQAHCEDACDGILYGLCLQVQQLYVAMAPTSLLIAT